MFTDEQKKKFGKKIYEYLFTIYKNQHKFYGNNTKFYFKKYKIIFYTLRPKNGLLIQLRGKLQKNARIIFNVSFTHYCLIDYFYKGVYQILPNGLPLDESTKSRKNLYDQIFHIFNLAYNFRNEEDIEILFSSFDMFLINFI